MVEIAEPVLVSPRPRRWNPAAAAWWSLLLTPAFGAWLHAANWRTLGNRTHVQMNMAFFWLTIGIAAASVGTMFVRDPSLLKLIEFVEKPMPVALLAGWYAAAGREQVQHVRELRGEYEKRGWGIPLLIGIAAVAVYIVVLGGIALYAVEPSPEDVAEDLRPTILEHWHSKPHLKDATIERIVLDPKGHGAYGGFIEATFHGKPMQVPLKVTYEGGSYSYEISAPEDE